MKCLKCGESLPTVGIWTRLEVTCPRCGGRHPPTWVVLFFAGLSSFLILIRLMTYTGQSRDDLLYVGSAISGIVVVASLWLWATVLWRRRRVVIPGPEKSA